VVHRKVEKRTKRKTKARSIDKEPISGMYEIEAVCPEGQRSAQRRRKIEWSTREESISPQKKSRAEVWEAVTGKIKSKRKRPSEKDPGEQGAPKTRRRRAGGVSVEGVSVGL